MNVHPTAIPGALILEPQVFGDHRGFFLESFSARRMRAIGIDAEFVQDNHSRSARHVLRGMHYQAEQTQGKLVRMVRGRVFDVVVDLRRRSPAFGKWVGVELSEQNQRILWIPPGLAHGFLVLSELADCVYKATDYYLPSAERTLLWNDPEVGIEWPLDGEPILSDKDHNGVPLCQAETFDRFFEPGSPYA
jgi:dTDP-4-dehydrorhamnose 3,5-epimerase